MGLAVPAARGGLVHLDQRALKILDHLGEGPLYRAPARDQHIIIALARPGRGRQAYDLLETPPCPIANHGPTEAFRRGKAEAGDFGIERRTRPPPRLENERRRREAASALHEHKFRPGLETSDGRHRGEAVDTA